MKPGCLSPYWQRVRDSSQGRKASPVLGQTSMEKSGRGGREVDTGTILTTRDPAVPALCHELSPPQHPAMHPQVDSRGMGQSWHIELNLHVVMTFIGHSCELLYFRSLYNSKVVEFHHNDVLLVSVNQDSPDKNWGSTVSHFSIFISQQRQDDVTTHPLLHIYFLRRYTRNICCTKHSIHQPNVQRFISYSRKLLLPRRSDDHQLTESDNWIQCML